MVASCNQKTKQKVSINLEQGRLSKQHVSMELLYFNKSVALNFQRYRRHEDYLKPQLLRLLCPDILNVRTFRLNLMIDMIQRFLSS